MSLNGDWGRHYCVYFGICDMKSVGLFTRIYFAEYGHVLYRTSGGIYRMASYYEARHNIWFWIFRWFKKVSAYYD